LKNFIYPGILVRFIELIMKTIIKLLFFYCILLIPCNFSVSQPILNSDAIFQPVIAKHGMVASDNREATEAGINILKSGGNAIDAAVTVGFTLAATFPRAGNLGGGGFMLIYLAKDKKVIAIDYRETAPKEASRDMFLDEHGDVDTEKSRYSYLSAGVPGTPAGLVLALDKYGTMSLNTILKPAIHYAENGITVDYELKNSLSAVKDRMEKSRDAAEIFYGSKHAGYKVGDKLIQKDLAWSLKQIGEHGVKAFYEGDIASKIADDMNENGGIITLEDLKSYKPVIRNPVVGTYRDFKIYSMPPPSSGGIHLIQMLNILEHFPIGSYGYNSAGTIHLMTETMKFAYADRSKHLGDTDFVEVPAEFLISKKYAGYLASRIKPLRTTPSGEIRPGSPAECCGGNNTTQFTVSDRWGNIVSNTYTINFSYGSKIVAKGTGILLNNEMDDFSAKPGVPNAYGLIGGESNTIKAGKRMLSSMTPTIILKDGNPFLATGSPGGSKIISIVLQIITDVIDHNMNIATATVQPRFHHQWLPDKIEMEDGFSEDTIKILRGMGHTIETGKVFGSTQSIMKRGNYYYGFSDPRRTGGLTDGY